MDHPILNGTYESDTQHDELEQWLKELKDEAIRTNAEWSTRLGISPSVAITTVKPSGTVSQLVDSSSGIHPRHSKYYLRTVRADKKDPLAQFMQALGFYCEDDITKPDTTLVFYFPIASPAESTTRTEVNALEQLEHYLIFKKHWCEHNPSITVYVKDNEWLKVAAWVYEHLNEIGGISFLPWDGGAYRQAPYQEITQEEYNTWKEKMPKEINWLELQEEKDLTNGMQELSCMAGVCEIN